jgi:hypothetical protein
MRQIDLNGPQGNAFVLLGFAQQWAKDLGKDAKVIRDEMTSGDYENLVKVFKREFGNVCEVYYG